MVQLELRGHSCIHVVPILEAASLQAHRRGAVNRLRVVSRSSAPMFATLRQAMVDEYRAACQS
jgi:hypothetical protein